MNDKKLSLKVLDYPAVLNKNRDVFLLNFKQELIEFDYLNSRFESLAYIISHNRDRDGNSHVSLSIFLLVIMRQYSNAFDCLSRYQSYQSWTAFRPALEAFLIMGKFLDDPKNADLWKNKRQLWMDRKKNPGGWNNYRKEFDGQGLVPRSLSFGAQLRQLLSFINDDYVHMNYDYFSKSHDVSDSGAEHVYVEVPFVDSDQNLHKAHLYAFLHVLHVMLESALEVFGGKYDQLKTAERVLGKFEQRYASNVEALRNQDPSLKEILNELGLWKPISVSNDDQNISR